MAAVTTAESEGKTKARKW